MDIQSSSSVSYPLPLIPDDVLEIFAYSLILSFSLIFTVMNHSAEGLNGLIEIILSIPSLPVETRQDYRQVYAIPLWFPKLFVSLVLKDLQWWKVTSFPDYLSMKNVLSVKQSPFSLCPLLLFFCRRTWLLFFYFHHIFSIWGLLSCLLSNSPVISLLKKPPVWLNWLYQFLASPCVFQCCACLPTFFNLVFSLYLNSPWKISFPFLRVYLLSSHHVMLCSQGFLGVVLIVTFLVPAWYICGILPAPLPTWTAKPSQKTQGVVRRLADSSNFLCRFAIFFLTSLKIMLSSDFWKYNNFPSFGLHLLSYFIPHYLLSDHSCFHPVPTVLFVPCCFHFQVHLLVCWARLQLCLQWHLCYYFCLFAWLP